jgi:hypothetical protein
MGIDSIIDSKGKIPEIFLRGVGLPDEWITQISSLLWDGIQFFSCFISYSGTSHLLFGCMMHFRLKGYDAGWMKSNYFPATTSQESWSGGYTCGTNSCSAPQKIRLRVGG